jgi:hypothetical protein
MTTLLTYLQWVATEPSIAIGACEFSMTALGQIRPSRLRWPHGRRTAESGRLCCSAQVVSLGPMHEVAALQPAARGQEPKGREPIERTAIARWEGQHDQPSGLLTRNA